MAKRFIDSKMWDKAWYRRLSPKCKLIWVYLLTRCDHAGIWDADWEAMNFFIGENVAYKDLPESITEKMFFISEGNQYFIPSFISFQYGVLRENSKPHLSVIKRLNEKGLLNSIESVPSTLKDKDKDKDKFKGKSKENREAEFKEKCFVISNEIKSIGEGTVYSFVDYWTESNMKGTRMKFEMQKTFDIKRRLNKWFNNEKEWNLKSEKKISFESTFKKTPTGLYKAYCSKCGKREMPNNRWQLKEGSNCCRVDYVSEKL